MSGQQIGFYRVSSVQQNFERQEHLMSGQQFDKVFSEKVSGKASKRLAMDEMIAYARQGDTVTCASLDRFGRSMLDLHANIKKLMDKGVSVRFLKEGFTFTPGQKMDAMQELQFNMLASFASFEASLIAERCADGRAAKKAAGEQYARGNGKAIDRTAIGDALKAGGSITQVAEQFNVGKSTVQRIRAELKTA